MACLTEHLSHTGKTEDKIARCPSCREELDEDYVEALQRNTDELGLKCNLHKNDKKDIVIEPNILTNQLKYRDLYLKQKENNSFFTGEESHVLDLRSTSRQPNAAALTSSNPSASSTDAALPASDERNITASSQPENTPSEQDSLIISFSSLMNNPSTPQNPKNQDQLGSTGSTGTNSNVEDSQSELSVTLSHDESAECCGSNNLNVPSCDSTSHGISTVNNNLIAEQDDLCYTDDDAVDDNMSKQNGELNHISEAEEEDNGCWKKLAYDETTDEVLAPHNVTTSNKVEVDGPEMQNDTLALVQDSDITIPDGEVASHPDVLEGYDQIVADENQEVTEVTEVPEEMEEKSEDMLGDSGDEISEELPAEVQVGSKNVTFGEATIVVTDSVEGANSREIQTQTRRQKRNRSNKRRGGNAGNDNHRRRDQNFEGGRGGRGGHNKRFHSNELEGVVYRRGGGRGRRGRDCRSYHEDSDKNQHNYQSGYRRHSFSDQNWRAEQRFNNPPVPAQPRFKPPRILRQEAMEQAKRLKESNQHPPQPIMRKAISTYQQAKPLSKYAQIPLNTKSEKTSNAGSASVVTGSKPSDKPTSQSMALSPKSQKMFDVTQFHQSILRHKTTSPQSPATSTSHK